MGISLTPPLRRPSLISSRLRTPSPFVSRDRKASWMLRILSSERNLQAISWRVAFFSAFSDLYCRRFFRRSSPSI